jgi:glycosyltransferase involved in cell wall biosynthesis
MRVGVVIPTLNEAARIGARLAELARMGEAATVVVADGGSTDGTVSIARSFPGVTLLTAPRGRGTQMNAGARVLVDAGAEVLLFLHADVSLPPDASAWPSRRLAVSPSSR